MTDQEVNELLATKLMGWRLLPAQGAMNQDFYEDRHEQFKWWAEPGFRPNVWSPTTDITQALGDGGEGTVAGELYRKLTLNVHINWDGKLAEAVISYNEDHDKYPKSSCSEIGDEVLVVIEADTPARAISLAAIAACEALRGKEGE